MPFLTTSLGVIYKPPIAVVLNLYVGGWNSAAGCRCVLWHAILAAVVSACYRTTSQPQHRHHIHTQEQVSWPKDHVRSETAHFVRMLHNQVVLLHSFSHRNSRKLSDDNTLCEESRHFLSYPCCDVSHRTDLSRTRRLSLLSATRLHKLAVEYMSNGS
jgi:hypothetical protein